MLCQRKEALGVPRITPELSRAAKRHRLERLVRALATCCGTTHTTPSLSESPTLRARPDDAPTISRTQAKDRPQGRCRANARAQPREQGNRNLQHPRTPSRRVLDARSGAHEYDQAEAQQNLLNQAA